MSSAFGTEKHVEVRRLTPEQRAVLRRLEGGEITADEAEKELVASLRMHELSTGEDGDESRQAQRDDAPAMSTEDEVARRMIERIAREVDEESRR
ncbi:MAG: hypothetical protein ACRDNY_03010 [Gaiellaceae bacterium]